MPREFPQWSPEIKRNNLTAYIDNALFVQYFFLEKNVNEWLDMCSIDYLRGIILPDEDCILLNFTCAYPF